MFEYVATVYTRMGLPLIRAGFDSCAAAELWAAWAYENTSHAGYYEIARNGEQIKKG